MKQQAVHDYVKKKRGLYAADGGEVPDEEEELPEEAPAPVEAPEADDSGEDVGAVSAPMDRNAAIRAHLAQKYAQAADTGGVQAASDARDRGNMISRVFEGLEGAARADSMAHGGAGVNHAGYQDVRNENNQNVGRAEAARQSNIQGFLRKNEMDRQVAQDALKSDDAARKQKAAGLIAARSDPNSPYSRSVQPVFQQLWGDQLGGDVDVTKLSATQLGDMATQLEKREAVGQKRDRAVDAHQESMAKIGATNASKKLADENRQDLVSGRADKATSADFDKFTNSLRGSVRDSIGGEKTKMRAATHAMAILGDKDLDNLTPEQAQEIGGAMAATISPGSPAEHTISAMTPKSAHADLSKALEYITGAPVGAGLGEQMKLYKSMLDRQINTSKDIISGELGPTIANTQHLAKKDPERYNAILHEAGITLGPQGSIMAYEPRYAHAKGVDATAKGDGATALAAPTTPPLDAIEAEMARRKLKPKTQGASGGF